MQIFYKTRNAARNSLKSHKLVDNGTDSKPNRRWARELVKPVKELVQKRFADDTMFVLAA